MLPWSAPELLNRVTHGSKHLAAEKQKQQQRKWRPRARAFDSFTLGFRDLDLGLGRIRTRTRPRSLILYTFSFIFIYFFLSYLQHGIIQAQLCQRFFPGIHPIICNSMLSLHFCVLAFHLWSPAWTDLHMNEPRRAWAPRQLAGSVG